MKIAFVTHSAYPEYIGGREQHIHFLAKTICKNKEDDIIVFTASKTKKIIREKIDDTYWLIRIPRISIKVSTNPLQIYSIVPKLFNLLKEEKPDILHVFEYGSYMTTVAYLYAYRYKIPFILTAYGYQLKGIILKCCKILYDMCIGRQLLRYSKAIICVSKQQYYEIVKIGGEYIKKQSFVKANSIPVNYYNEYVNKKLSPDFYQDFPFLMDDGIKLLTVARILPQKGIDILIQALNYVVYKYNFKNIRLILIGPNHGALGDIQAMIDKLNLTHNIFIIGPVPHPEILNFYAISDIIVLPSLYEGVPLVLLEAMCYSKPIIATSLPGILEIIKDGETGLLIRPRDAANLAEAIIKLSLNPVLREKLGLNAKNTVYNYDSLNEIEFLYSIYNRNIS